MRASVWVALGTVALATAGCSSSSSSSSGSALGSTLASIMPFQRAMAPTPEEIENARKNAEAEFECPAVAITSEGAALRAYGGAAGDSQALRNQISITDVARECVNPAGGAYALKLGVQGRVLIGPAGAPGNYQANLRITVRQGTKAAVSRVIRVGATIPAGQSSADFVHVEQGIAVPAFSGPGTSEIEVGLEGGGAARAPRRGRSRSR